MTPDPEVLEQELAGLIAIPSVSADPARADDVRAAAEWVRERVRAAGGEAELVDWNGRPLVVGEVRASRDAERAPSILCYGHVDVQPVDPLELWESPPFELVHRGEWLYGRGVADDKGQLFMLLKAAELLAGADELPVNLRFACDGEEEIGGHSIVDFLAADGRPLDAAVVFDSGMIRPGLPALDVGVRGLCYFHVTVRTGARDLHSGMFGGASLNALHALVQALSGVLPRDGRLPEPLRAGVVPPDPEELADWEALPAGEEAIAEQGSRPADARAGAEFYLRTWAEPAVDVHGLAGGSPHQIKTVLPVLAEANVSIRLVPEQSEDELAETFARLLREAAPAGAEVEVSVQSTSPPARVSPDAPALGLALDAFEHVLGTRPLLVRSGGSIPIVAALAARSVPAIVTGFALPESNIHAPNERLPAAHLPLGVATARELFRRLGELPRGSP